ncbi:MAG: hypothetical protein QNJ16_16025 [Rhodobacter sp.]|nr:hypothetical protein [Rhodobacter sp.]
MGAFLASFKPILAAGAVLASISLSAVAQEVAEPQGEAADLNQMMAELSDPETENWQSLERRIRSEWSKSGSPAMDLLLQRGQKALEDEDYDTALEHLTALIDHAPDFAEGWNARATAYFHKKMYGPAMQDIGQALALNPNHFAAITGLAVMLQEMGYDDDALEAWRVLQAIHPHRPELKDAIERLEQQTGGVRL